MKFVKKINVQLVLIACWFVFTSSMVGWWVYYGLVILPEKLSASEFRMQRMFLYEGITFMALLALASGVMLYFVLREQNRSRQVREFFAAFSHDLKTSIASLRLQAESLQEDLADKPDVHSKYLDRLASDTVRLELQLENSLFLANVDKLQLYYQDVAVDEYLKSIRSRWPDLEIDVEGSARLRVDTRAFESIVTNLVQNSVVHGEARRIQIRIRPEPANSMVRISLLDDGRGLQGSRDALAHLFGRAYPGSGSGVGLYISRMLARRMQGDLSFPENDHGFAVELKLPEARA